ncbi:DUF6049 family protein [Cellulomonas alba]|uniref:DUF6049 family protein n=1 Tax=Cellulomonas alba TaxID=3053467 RepID=A0ABT7SFQ6_9CELL|nr:DUF6049 family protein [Cellulomonas alba]MDM7855022.1 DUF6049 family protein [Cellulomonas alba]
MTRRGTWRRAAGAVLALAAGLTLAAAPAVAETDDGQPGLTVEITNVAPAVLQPGDDLNVDATLHNDTDRPIDDPTATLLIRRFNFTQRADLATFAAGGHDDQLDAPTAQAGTGQPLAPGASVSVHLTVPAAQVGFIDTQDAWGPRGIAVEGSSLGSVLGIQRSFVLWLPTQAGPMPQASLSVLVPVTGPPTTPVTSPAAAVPSPTANPGPTATAGTPVTPTITGDEGVDPATADALRALTAPGGRLTSTLAVLESDPGIGAAVDPRLLAQAATVGGTAKAWAEGVDATLALRDVATLPWADVDVAATVHAQETGLADLAIERSKSADVPGGHVGTLLWAPSKPDARTAALVPRKALAGLVAPVGSVTSAAAQKQAISGVQTVPTGNGDARLLNPDPVLTGLFTDPATIEPGATTATASQRLLAELAVLARRDSPAPVALVAPGRGWQPDAALVASEVATVRDAPWVSLTPISALLNNAGDAPERKLASTVVADSELAPRDVERLADARERARAFAGVTSNPDTSMRDVDDVVLAPLAVAWRADPAGRAALVDAVDETVTARTSGLSIAPLSDLNVISARSELRVTVRNALAVPATVHLVVSPRKACLQADQTDPLTVDAHDEKNVVVVLHATANCEVTVLAGLTNPAGQVVSAPVQFQARVAPTIESVGTIVVGVLLAIGLVLGIVRTVRRGQSARRGARLQAEATRDDAPLALAPLGGVTEPRPEDEGSPRTPAAGTSTAGMPADPSPPEAPR